MEAHSLLVFLGLYTTTLASGLELSTTGGSSSQYVLLYPCSICKKLMKRWADPKMFAKDGKAHTVPQDVCPDIEPAYQWHRQRSCLQYVNGRCYSWDDDPDVFDTGRNLAAQTVRGKIINPFWAAFSFLQTRQSFSSMKKTLMEDPSLLEESSKAGKNRKNQYCKRIFKFLRSHPLTKKIMNGGCTYTTKKKKPKYKKKCPASAACSCLRDPDGRQLCGPHLATNSKIKGAWRSCVSIGPATGFFSAKNVKKRKEDQKKKKKKSSGITADAVLDWINGGPRPKT